MPSFSAVSRRDGHVVLAAYNAGRGAFALGSGPVGSEDVVDEGMRGSILSAGRGVDETRTEEQHTTKASTGHGNCQ